MLKSDRVSVRPTFHKLRLGTRSNAVTLWGCFKRTVLDCTSSLDPAGKTAIEHRYLVVAEHFHHQLECDKNLTFEGESTARSGEDSDSVVQYNVRVWSDTKLL